MIFSTVKNYEPSAHQINLVSICNGVAQQQPLDYGSAPSIVFLLELLPPFLTSMYLTWVL